MRFNRVLALGVTTLALGVATFALNGCSIGEGPPPAKVTNMSPRGLGCLKNFSQNLDDYFGGRATVADVNRIADCTVNALQTFGEVVRGENRDHFTAIEVRNFLQRYFLGDVIVSDGLLAEMMRVKQALVGGKADEFSPEDLKSAESLINDFRSIFIRLQPVMPLSIDRVETEGSDYVDAEASAIADVGDILGRRITANDSTYSFDELGRLLDEVGKVFPGSAGTLGRTQDRLKSAGILKQMLISPGSPRNTVTDAEWRLIFQDGSRWLGNYLKYLNLEHTYPDWTRGVGRARLSVLLEESIDLLDVVVARNCPPDETHPGGRCLVAPGIPFSVIQEAMDSLDWDGTIGGMKFNRTTIEKELPTIFRHFFGGIDLTQTGRSTDRITSAHLDRLRALIREWIDGSRFLEGAYAQILHDDAFSDDAMVPTSAIRTIDAEDVLESNGGVTPAALATAESLQSTFGKTMALMTANSPGAVFDGKNKTRGRVYREMAQYTWLKPILKAALLGYMTGPSIKSRAAHVETDGLGLKEFTAMVADYWPFLVDFKLVGPSNSPVADSKKRFREAALFTPVSDGNNQIGLEEGVQLVLYALSATPLGDQVHARMAKLCPSGPHDEYGEPTIEPKCYREKVFDLRSSNRDMRDLWASFPVLVHYYDGLSAGDRAAFGNFVEASIRDTGRKPTDYFSSDESGAIPMLFHYVETVFLRFDQNADGFIDRSEAVKAFPIFQNTLAGIAPMNPDDPKLESVFCYLLANGSPPVNDEMGGWSRFWHGVEFIWFDKTKPDFKANRLRLFEVFATLSTEDPAPSPALAARH